MSQELPSAVPSVTPAAAGPLRRRLSLPQGWASGITAIGVKELRGRMRGRRAFVFLTIYLVTLAGFAWMVEVIAERSIGAFNGQGVLASAQIGQAIFVALLMFETVLIIVLAPSFTAGAISLEREKQTLDLLAATPISSLAIVLGKLLSALTYVFVLVLGSIPLTAMVFVFGGVAPDDVIRGYVVLLATAIGLGSVGLFFSALVRRTQAATILTYAGVLAVTLGGAFIFIFWAVVPIGGPVAAAGPDGTVQPQRPPEAILYLNPFVAQADVACGTETSVNGGWCGIISSIENRNLVTAVVGGAVDQAVPQPATVGQGIPPNKAALIAQQQQQQLLQKQQGPFVQAPNFRDSFWPKSVAAWLILSAVLVFLSLQLVTPTRRWHLGRPSFPRRSGKRGGP